MKHAGIKIENTTVKHLQIIGMREFSHQKLKMVPQINVIVDQLQWLEYVNFAVLAQNKNYHSSPKCSPPEMFHGWTRQSALDLKFGDPICATIQLKDISRKPDMVNEKYKENVQYIVTAYHKNKAYYDGKASTQPLKVNDFVFCWIQRRTT